MGTSRNCNEIVRKHTVCRYQYNASERQLQNPQSVSVWQRNAVVAVSAERPTVEFVGTVRVNHIFGGSLSRGSSRESRMMRAHLLPESSTPASSISHRSSAPTPTKPGNRALNIHSRRRTKSPPSCQSSAVDGMCDGSLHPCPVRHGIWERPFICVDFVQVRGISRRPGPLTS